MIGKIGNDQANRLDFLFCGRRGAVQRSAGRVSADGGGKDAKGGQHSHFGFASGGKHSGANGDVARFYDFVLMAKKRGAFFPPGFFVFPLSLVFRLVLAFFQQEETRDQEQDKRKQLHCHDQKNELQHCARFAHAVNAAGHQGEHFNPVIQIEGKGSHGEGGGQDQQRAQAADCHGKADQGGGQRHTENHWNKQLYVQAVNGINDGGKEHDRACCQRAAESSAFILEQLHYALSFLDLNEALTRNRRLSKAAAPSTQSAAMMAVFHQGVRGMITVSERIPLIRLERERA